VEEETLRSTLGGDTEEVVERPQVFHRELSLKSADRALKKVDGGRREHDVVDVE
jgi:hypothetical protein